MLFIIAYPSYDFIDAKHPIPTARKRAVKKALTPVLVACFVISNANDDLQNVCLSHVCMLTPWDILDILGYFAYFGMICIF